ncbi:DUF3182 family protein [Azohydromonas caseinilytica]|uniref:DUF3182 family protein n=1 Tax=Azohydromonas caseinilytica TaxID=2728836 RepID=A0A848F9E2_9BURK|nr:DUF3182 family protein [Azohydromonas caseinilytica]NML14953.1 DUF3182 family protein [Azohydromonas caseinilytica]
MVNVAVLVPSAGGRHPPFAEPAARARPAITPHERLSFVPCRTDARQHELASHRGIARRLAALMGCDFAEGDAAASSGALGYVVPNETIFSLEAARRLGVCGEEDLFGGVVPAPFVATKVITHPLIRPDAPAPAGWSECFGQRVRDSVLPGFSVFSVEDAREAGRQLLQDGPVRLKLACGIGGSGQSVARDARELAAQLDALPADVLSRHGLVLERNLADEVHTYSIGLLRLGTLVASYFGTQRNTLNRQGQEVYGGSTLTVVRGGFERLEQLAADDAGARRAVALARTYHEAACDCFEGFLASRANYDVVQGRDAAGRMLAGVLEQSWRIGGASGAEVAALQALCDDPARETARASTVELHGEPAELPEGAVLYYQGVDEHVGPITKYALLHSDET